MLSTSLDRVILEELDGPAVSELRRAIAEVKQLTTEIDCDQTAMGLPPVTSALFRIAKSFW
jgi:hypothetical protein